ncbi:MAG: class I SAM-dependent methyltransferase [Oscillospiraceae bacterium]|nr:class I SAM-dependent methyltransferase [Oscillospiraceae bacterium]
MDSNREKVIAKYSGGKEDNRYAESRSTGLEFHYTKKLLAEYITPGSRVIELGCATGYYGMFFADKCAEYTGIDLSPDNIAVFNKKIAAEGKTNLRAAVGDAASLPEFADNSFDAVLCLGPMYHLSREERAKVFNECYRIARTGAVLAFAYINGIGVYAGACVDDRWRRKRFGKWRSIYPNAKTNEYVFEHHTDDERPGLFFFTSPEEMEYDAGQKKLAVIKNCGLDFFFAASAVNTMSGEQFAWYMELADRMSASRSCTGLANHALMICRK